MNETDLYSLAQLISAMEDCLKQLELYYNKNDIENFSKVRKAMLEFQARFAQIISK